MAISFSQNYFRNSAGVQWEILGRLSLDNSYPTGGYLIDPLQFGLSQVTNFSVTDNVSGYGFDYNASSQKLLVYQSGTGGVLAAHSHSLQSVSDNLVVAVFRVYYDSLVGGPFQVGETITGSISGLAGTISAVEATYLDFAAATELQYGEVITGGTSGATANTISSGTGVVTPTSPVFALHGVSYTDDIGSTSPVPVGARVNIVQGLSLGNQSLGCRINAANDIEVCPDAADGGVLTSIQIDYITASTSAVSGGTVTGGGEVPNATDLSAITNVEYRVVGL